MMKNGVYAASLTPMAADFSCAYQEFAEHCKNLLERGCTGILIFGTTGEGPSFSLHERKKALQFLIDQGVDPNRLMVGITFSALEDTLDLARFALSLNCTSMLLAPPFFFRNVSDAGIIAFYREFIKRVDNPHLKVLLYHIPAHCPAISLKAIELLSKEFPHSIVGIKESSGDWTFTKQLLTQFPGFKIFVGNETYITKAVQAGAAGAITGLTNIFPEMICSLYELGMDPKKPDANEAMKQIVEIVTSYPIQAAIKCLAWHWKGPLWQPLRPPLLPLDSKQKEQLIQALQSIKERWETPD